MALPLNLSNFDPSHILGVAFDIDDTLTYHGKVQPEAFDAIWKLHHAGLKLVPVTGRPTGWAEVIAQLWPVDFVVAENGATWVTLSGGRLHTFFFESKGRRQSFFQTWDEIRKKVEEQNPQVQITSDQHMRYCDLAFETGALSGVSEADLQILDQIILEHGAKPVRSSIHTHAHLGDFDKALGFKKAAQATLKTESLLDFGNWVFIGDSLNDEPMFESFEHSVGVINIEPYLQKLETKPKFMTAKSHGKGFAEFANHLLSAKK